MFSIFFLFFCLSWISSFFFFNDTATTEIYTLSLHDALPICRFPSVRPADRPMALEGVFGRDPAGEIQRSLVAAPPEVPRHRAAGGSDGCRFRSRREVSRTGQRALHALLPCLHSPVSVPPRPGGGR